MQLKQVEKHIENLRKEIAENSSLQNQSFNSIKSFFDSLKNKDQKVVFEQKQLMICFFKQTLDHLKKLKRTEKIAKTKIKILQEIEKEFISTKYNSEIFHKLFDIMKNEQEDYAIAASKTINILTKMVSDKKYSLDIKNHYLPLLKFLKERTQFLHNLKKYVDQGNFNRYSIKQDKRKQNNQDEIPENRYSLKFLIQIPNLFVHIMAYVDVWKQQERQNLSQIVSNLLQQSINNMVKSLKQTYYQYYKKYFNIQFNRLLFEVLTKFLHFLFIILKAKQQKGKCFRKYIDDQVKYIKVTDILKYNIFLLCNCPDEFLSQRYDIVSRLKILVGLLNPTEHKISKQDSTNIIKDILNQKIIFGKNRFIGDYYKNAIENFWLDIVKSKIIMNFLIPPSISLFFKNNTNQNHVQFQNQFNNVQKVVQKCIKNIFDNSIYITVQDRSIDLLILICTEIFKTNQTSVNEVIQNIQSNIVSKRIHQNKIKMVTQILNAVANKFAQLVEIFRQVIQFCEERKTQKQVSEDITNLKHIQIHSLPMPNLNDRIDILLKSDCTIQGSLITLTTAPINYVSIYEQDQQFLLNGQQIKQNFKLSYFKDVKSKILQKLITLGQKIIQLLITWNPNGRNPNQINYLKQIYFYNHVANRKILSETQCDIFKKLLKKGLEIYQILHDFGIHSDQSNKKGHFKNFMTIFSKIYDPINFRDIFMPNKQIFFSHLLKYTKFCHQTCLQWMLIDSFCSNQNTHKNIVELLIYTLLINFNTDTLDSFHSYFIYKDEYFSLIQKLIRFPFRCLYKYKDDSFIRNYFRQIVLMLIKKAHNSYFCIDHLHLLRTLFKNILWHSGYLHLNSSPLYNQFNYICNKFSTLPGQRQRQNSNNFINVNILENLILLFQTGIYQLIDIVTELIIMLPLKSKTILTLARSGHLIKPLVHCLTLGDNHYVLRSIKTLQVIFQYSSSYQLQKILEGVKVPLVNSLKNLAYTNRVCDYKLQSINNDLATCALKLLAKMGKYPRLVTPEIEMQGNSEYKIKEYDIVICLSKCRQKKFHISMYPIIQFCTQNFNKYADPYLQSHYLLSAQTIEMSFDILVLSGKWILNEDSMHPLCKRILELFLLMTTYHNKYTSFTTYLLNHINKQIKEFFNACKEKADMDIIEGRYGFLQIYIDSLCKNLSQKVLITRQDYNITQISHEPKKTCQELLFHLMKHQEMIQRVIQNIFVIYNKENKKNSLNLKCGIMTFIHQHISRFYIYYIKFITELLNVIYEGINVSNIIKIKAAMYPKQIMFKLIDYINEIQPIANRSIKEPVMQKLIQKIFSNVISYKAQSTEISLMALRKLQQYGLNLIQLLYKDNSKEQNQTVKWNTIQQENPYINCQSKYNFSKIRECFPQSYLTKILNKIQKSLNINFLDYISDQALKSNIKKLTLMANTFKTIQFLMTIKGNKQAFRILKYPQGEMLLRIQTLDNKNEFPQKHFIIEPEFEEFIKNALKIIEVNEKLYGHVINIILQKNQNKGNQSNSTNANSFNINTNIYFDDEQYQLNIQDIDIEIKHWGFLISSIIKFFKTTLLLPHFLNISKINLRQKNQQNYILIHRSSIIFKLFELITRVDRTVRKTSTQCLKQLLQNQQHPKQLLNNDDKLKKILRPVLICLQHDFKKFSPSFLYVFKKILKLVTKCFNQALSQKLMNHLQDINQKNRHISNQDLQKNISYFQITSQCKCIASLIGLFSYVSLTYLSSGHTKYPSSVLKTISQYTFNLSKYFGQMLGKDFANNLLYEPLVKLQNIIYSNLNTDINTQKIDANFLELLLISLKKQQSYGIRQKIYRENSVKFMQSIQQHLKSHGSQCYFLCLKIINNLAKHGQNFLRKNKVHQILIKYFQKALNNKILNQNINKDTNTKNQIKLLLKILIKWCKQNQEQRQQIQVLFHLAEIFKLRSNQNLQFVRKFFRFQLPRTYLLTTQKQIFQQFIQYQNKIDLKIILAYNVIFPILTYNSYKKRLNKIISQTSFQKCIDLVQFYFKKKGSSNQYHQNKLASIQHKLGLQLLQIMSFLIVSLDASWLQQLKKNIVKIIWPLLKHEDKLVKNYASIAICNFIKHLGWPQYHPKVLNLYTNLFKSLDNLGQHQYEQCSLIKIALSILITFWNTTDRNNKGWIESAWRVFHEQPYESLGLVRFWEVFVKNHEIFYKFKESKIQIQMINSMQWLMVGNNPVAHNHIIKKIASDLSFIYIQWKYRQIKQKLMDQTRKQERLEILQKFQKEEAKAAQICLNFFIKIALNNCIDKDDKDLMKRSLYLFKKMLILWPSPKKRFETIKSVVNKIKQNTNSQLQQDPIRFYYALLHIIYILLNYDSDVQTSTQTTKILHFFDNNTGTRIFQSHNNIYSQPNPYILYLFFINLKRMFQIAKIETEESKNFINEITEITKEGLDIFIKQSINKTHKQNTHKYNARIQLSILICNLLYQFNYVKLLPLLNQLKQVAIKINQKKQQNIKNYGKIQQKQNIHFTSFKQAVEKQSFMQQTFFLQNQKLSTIDDTYQTLKENPYWLKRLIILILIRLLGCNFNYFSEIDQEDIIELYFSIFEKNNDYQLKLEIINIFKCLFIGTHVFNNIQIPLIYKNFSLAKMKDQKILSIFFNSSKLFDLIQKKKLKNPDQSYNITQKINQQIVTRSYFNFLMKLLKRWRLRDIYFNDQIKTFIILSSRICDNQQLSQFFSQLIQIYDAKFIKFFIMILQDIFDLLKKDLYSQNQNDEIIIFLIRLLIFIIRKKTQLFQFELLRGNSCIQIENKNAIIDIEIIQNMIKNQSLRLNSNHNKIITNIFINFMLQIIQQLTYHIFIRYQQKVTLIKSIQKFLVESQNLSQKLGQNFLKLIIEYMLPQVGIIINPYKIIFICQKLNIHGIKQKYIEQLEQRLTNQPNNLLIKQYQSEIYDCLDYIYSKQKDLDILYGFRICMTENTKIRQIFMYIQQRQYLKSINFINSKFNQINKKNSLQQILVQMDGQFQQHIQNKYILDALKQAYANVNKWDVLYNMSNKMNDFNLKQKCIYHYRQDSKKINEILKHLQNINYLQMDYYYGKAFYNFLQNNPLSKGSKQINVSLMYAMAQWKNISKFSYYQQNQLLSKVQCILQLQQGWKANQEGQLSLQQNSVGSPNTEMIGKMFQNIYKEVNTWKQRLPHKYENISLWKMIIEQRNIILESSKKKMQTLIEQSNIRENIQVNNSKIITQDLLISLFQNNWNQLRFIKQQRYFGIYSINKFLKSDQKLFYDESFMKIKQLFYYYFVSDNIKAEQILNQGIKDLLEDKNFEQTSLYQQQFYRLKGKIHMVNNNFVQASKNFQIASKSELSPTKLQYYLHSIWRDWLYFCFKGYISDKYKKKVQWAQNAIISMPLTLRYKPYKTRLLFYNILFILYQVPIQQQSQIAHVLQQSFQDIPYWTLMIWIPQIFNLIMNNKFVFKKNNEYKKPFCYLLQKIGCLYPQYIFYIIRDKIKNQQNIKDIFKKIRKIFYNLYFKIQYFVQNISKIMTNQELNKKLDLLNSVIRNSYQIQIPGLYFGYQKQPDSMSHPCIIHIDYNENKPKIIYLTGSNGKIYKFRASKSSFNYKQYLRIQMQEVLNIFLSMHRQSGIRKLKIFVIKKLFFAQDFYLSQHCDGTSFEKILNNYLLKSNIGITVAQNYKSILSSTQKVNKKMKQLVPQTMLKNYIYNRAKNYDDYYYFRKRFSYNYGVGILLNYILMNETYLKDFIIDMKNANVIFANIKLTNLQEQKIRSLQDKNLSPFTFRLSRNIICFITKFGIYGNILPAIQASISSFSKTKFNIRNYISILRCDCLNKTFPYDMQKIRNDVEGILKRMYNLMYRKNENNRSKDKKKQFFSQELIRRLKICQQLAESDQVGLQHKFWF